MALIIRARMEEIFDYVLWEIRRSGYDKKLIGGIVLTGGGSLLKHLDMLAEYHTAIPTRVGYPVDLLAHGYPEEIATPICATSIGLLKHAFENRDYEQAVEIESDNMEEPITEPVEVNMTSSSNSNSPSHGNQAGWWEKAFQKTKRMV